MILTNIVQVVSVLNCLSSLGQFLFLEHEIKKEDINKREPILNAMNKYLAGLESPHPNFYVVGKLNKMAIYLIKNDMCGSKNAENLVKSIEKKKNPVGGNKYVYLPEGEIAVVTGDRKLLSKLPVVFKGGIDKFMKQYKLESTIDEVKENVSQPKKDSKLKPTKQGSREKLQSIIDKVRRNSLQPKKNLKLKPTKPRRSPSKLQLVVDEVKKNNLQSKQDLKLIPTKLQGPSFKVPAGFRTHMLHEKDTRVQKALDTLANQLIRTRVAEELSKCLFLKKAEKTEVDFVKDWEKNNFGNKPEWSEEYKIELPEVFNKLRYEESLSELEVKPMSKKEEKELKDSGYAAKEGYKYMSYEDFIYMRKYIGADFFQVNADSKVGRKMRKALYQLAIRQSDDPPKEYGKIFYRGEKREFKNLDKLKAWKGDTIGLHKFTSFTTRKNLAESYGTCDSKDCLQLIYTVHMPEKFFRVKLEQLDINRAEEENLILPGSKLKVKEVVSTENKKGITIVHAEMEFVSKSKLEDIKYIMKELKKLKDSGA